MEFQLSFPNHIVFGENRIDYLGEHLKDYGKRCLMVTGNKSIIESGALSRIEKSLNQANIVCVGMYSVKSEPDCLMVDEVRAAAQGKGADLIIGIGGGSVLDIAKAAAGLYGQRLRTEAYVNGATIQYCGIPFIAIPTTAGTGSEITTNAVLYNPITGNKASLAHPAFQARLSIVDPILTYDMSPKITAATGMDALTHAIESYTSNAANPVTMVLAEKAIELIGSSLERAVKNPRDGEARSNMAMGSMTAALAFAQTGVGIAHAISHPLGALFHIPHGVINAILLPAAIDFNHMSCSKKYRRVEILMGANKNLSEYIRQMVKEMPIPHSLTEAGYSPGREREIIEKTFQSRSLAKNPREAKAKDIMDLLEACI